MDEIRLGETLVVAVADLWRVIARRVGEGPFGSSPQILARRQQVEALAASLPAGGPSAMPASTPERIWWRLGVSRWRKLGDANELDAARTGSVGAPKAKPDSARALWVWDSHSVPPELRAAFVRALDESLGIGSDASWTGTAISASDLDPDTARVVESGWNRLQTYAPNLAATLGGHVECVAWVDLRAPDTIFNSGTTPDLPGVVLISADKARDPDLFDEAFVHEAAHCKFFDLCLARDVVGPLDLARGEEQPAVHPPWVEETSLRSARWTGDQALAAAHAYVHLAVLAGSALATPELVSEAAHWQRVRAESLSRADFLLSATETWSLGVLGADGPAFVRWLWDLQRLVCAVADIAAEWRGTGPRVSVPRRIEVGSPPDADAAALGIVGSGDVMWIPQGSRPFLPLRAPASLGEIVASAQRESAETAAETVINAVDFLTSLSALGIVALEANEV